jgi:FecR-like protein
VGKGWGRRRLLIAAVIAALVVVPAALVLTQQRASGAATILSILDGSASIARGTAAFAPASDGDLVNIGDSVQTAISSHAMVTFFDGSTLEIEPATTVQIEDAASAASGAISIRISQTIGRTWASVQKLTRVDSKFEIRTPTAVAAVRGTGFITEVLADGTTTVQTTDGNVQVTAQGQSVLVGQGQTTTVPPNSPPSGPVSRSTPPNLLRFGMHSPVYLAVVDQFGRACGIVEPGPTVVRQIPGCLATGPGTDPQLVDIPNATAGTYQIYIASIAPGGSFVATASALDSLGNLSFNYITSGSGQPGDKFASKIDVSTGQGGVLIASGLGPLTLIDRSAVKVVMRSASPQPSASGTPDTSLFSPLPAMGFGPGVLVMSSLIASGASPVPPAPTPDPTIISVATPTPPVPIQTPLPTLPTTPLPTLPPTPIPTAPPTPLPTLPPTPVPTPTPTPQPTPTPLPPTLSGGTAQAGGTLGVLGTNWPVGAAITITWPDGTQIATADVQPNGQFATLIRVPANAIPGTTYTITARGAGLIATADVTVRFTPTLTLLVSFPPRAGTSVPYSGTGWPANGNYSLLFDGRAIGGGTTSAAGTLLGPTGGNPSFIVPQNTTPGAHTVTVTSGTASASASLTTQ